MNDDQQKQGTQGETKTKEIENEPKITYRIEEKELKKIEIEKNIFIRLIQHQDRRYVDIRKFYKGYPTKKGIRISNDSFSLIKKILDDF